MRNTVLKLLAGSLAAASLMAFSAPVYAATAEQSSAQAAGWCELVPTFCGNHCGGSTARCNPCGPVVTGLKARDVQVCNVKLED